MMSLGRTEVSVPPQQNLWVSSGFGRRPDHSQGGSIPSTKRSFTEQAGNPPVLNLVDSDMIAMQSVARRLDYVVPVIASPQIHPSLHRWHYTHLEPGGHRLGTRRSHRPAPGYGYRSEQRGCG